MHHVNQWPPLYATFAAMPCEAAEVLLYCLCSEAAAKQGDKLLDIARQTQEDLWRELAGPR